MLQPSITLPCVLYSRAVLPLLLLLLLFMQLYAFSAVCVRAEARDETGRDEWRGEGQGG